jgi:ferredoxin
MRVSVDLRRCEGHGQCLLAAPAVFDMHETKPWAVVLNPEPPDEMREEIIRAASMCPAAAIDVH